MNCQYLINSLHINIHGEVFPCTVTSSFSSACIGNIYNSSLEEIYNNRIKNNKCRDYCDKCLRYKRAFRDWNEDSHDYYFLDLRFDNVCNFMCRMCNGDNSIALKKEDNTIKERNITSLLFKNFAFINKFRRIYIGGGEPFLSPSISTFLELLSKDKVILLSSNISILKNEVIEILKQFKKVVFYPSIDGIDNVGSYIRHGFKTDIYFKNFDILKSIFVCVPAVTVSAMNLLSLDKLIKKIGEHTDINSIYINVLDNPSEYHVSVLPSYLKSLYQARIKNIKTSTNQYFYNEAPYNLYYGLENLDIALAKSTSLDFNKTKQALSIIDKKRNQDYRDLFGGDV